MKRFIIELGMGADLHGGDVTKATQKAMKDAISHCCLCGLTETIRPKKIQVRASIACPCPEQLDLEALNGILPIGELVIESVSEGGMQTKGLHVSELGEGDQIVISLVALTVYVAL